ncbi:MAG: LPXTG cell wall anchor domain-containing protein [Myxococcota bacterium]
MRSLIVAAVACVLGAAVPTWAAQVVDVRVGQHAGFSRVVLELDSAVGYKVERTTPTSGADEWVISLDAGAKPRSVHRRFDFIESVEIVPTSGTRSTVRVRLRGEDLELSEMILANPPRIVLDVHRDAPMRDTPAKPARAPEAEETLRTHVDEVSETATSQPPASMPASAAGDLGEEGRKLALAANPSMAQPSPQKPMATNPSVTRPSPQKPMAGSDKPKPTIRLSPKTSLSSREPSSMPREPRPSLRERGLELPKKSSSSLFRIEDSPRPPAPKPAENARPQKPSGLPSTPATLPPPTADSGLFKSTNVTVGAAGLLLLVGAGLVFMRRRNAAGVADPGELDDHSSDDDRPFASSELSAGSVAGDEIEAETEEIPISEAGQAEVGIPIPDDDASALEGTPSAQEETDMDTVSEDPRSSILDVPAAAAMAGGGDSVNLIAQLERRIASMETRIDEVVDSKERLERQVAAQTEELRVQRAAIARTQRAVRNLSRAGEASPTEPAIRDPLRPEGPRED